MTALVKGDGKIGVWLAAMLVAGNMMGSAVYLMPTVLASVGGISLIGWGVALVGALLLSAMFAGFADYGLDANENEGLIGRITAVLGPFWGYQTSTLYSVACWVGNVAIALGVTGYAASFVPMLSQGVASVSFTILVIVVMTVVNIFGSGFVSRVQTATLLIGLAPVIVICIAGWFVFKPDLFVAQWNVAQAPVSHVLGVTVLPIFWAFLGLETAAVCCVRLRDPQRNLAPATMLGVGFAGLIYAVSCVVLLGILPARGIAASTHPFADGALVIFGVGIGAVVAICAMIRAAGTLAGWILVAAETAQSAVASGMMPAVLAQPGDKATARTLIVVGGATVVFALVSAAPALAEQFTTLIDTTVLMSMIMYVLSAVAIWRLSATETRRGRKIFLRTVSVLSAAFCGVVIVTSSPTLLAITAGTSVLGALGYLFARPKLAAD